MPELKFIVREPLLDRQQQLIGYELTWKQPETDVEKPCAADLNALVELLADQLNDRTSGWPASANLLFVEVASTRLSTAALASLPPQTTVLTLTVDENLDAETVVALQALRARGFGISLRGPNLAAQDKMLLALATHIEMRFTADNFTAQAKIYASLKQLPVRKVARQVGSWQEYDACVLLGLDAFAGQFHATPRPGSLSKGLNPAQTIILRLMGMVRKNADVHQLEDMLKRDAALSYKLLRYINSAGFGLGFEIQSLRHGVQVLGYNPLYRWLSVLLATASTNEHSIVLMQTAIIRGRLTELLGQPFLPKSDAENLFVTGMFSLLDRVLGIPMDDVLDKIQLPEAVSEALLTRTGMYAPFLALAEACEQASSGVSTLDASLDVDAALINQAHLSALAWAQNLEI